MLINKVTNTVNRTVHQIQLREKKYDYEDEYVEM